MSLLSWLVPQIPEVPIQELIEEAKRAEGLLRSRIETEAALEFREVLKRIGSESDA